MKPRFWMGLLIAVVLMTAFGCSQKLTYERWQTISVGNSSSTAVEATLGEPWKKAGETWVYNDPDRGVTAMIKLRDDKVVGKEWADAKRGMETIGEQPDEPNEAEHLRIQQVK